MFSLYPHDPYFHSLLKETRKCNENMGRGGARLCLDPGNRRLDKTVFIDTVVVMKERNEISFFENFGLAFVYAPTKGAIVGATTASALTLLVLGSPMNVNGVSNEVFGETIISALPYALVIGTIIGIIFSGSIYNEEYKKVEASRNKRKFGEF